MCNEHVYSAGTIEEIVKKQLGIGKCCHCDLSKKGKCYKGQQHLRLAEIGCDCLVILLCSDNLMLGDAAFISYPLV